MIQDFFYLHLQLLPFCLGFFSLTWLVSLPLKDVSIVDRVWGLGFIFYFVTAFFYAGNSLSPVSLLGFLMITVWGVRLSVHIHMRNKGHAEDYRYQKMRKKYKPFSLLSLPIVFWLQAVILWVVATPLLALASSQESVNIFSVLGLLTWATGFYFEAVGDWQLKQFKKNSAHKDQLLTTGLWSLTRHPNYFGDSLMWWGIFLVTLPSGWFTFIGPLVMTVTIIKISGVSLTDKSMKETKPGFEEYMKTTPDFLPKFSGYKRFEA